MTRSRTDSPADRAVSAGRFRLRSCWPAVASAAIGAAVLAAVLLAAPALARDGQASGASLDLDPRRGLRLRMFDGDIDLRLGGRIHLDTAFFDDDITPLDDDIELRRLRVHLRGRILRDWDFKVDGELSSGRTGIRALWLGYRGIENTRIRVGNVVAPVGMESQTSSNDILFLERSLVDVLAPVFQTGVLVSHHQRPRGPFGRAAWSVRGGVFVEPLGDNEKDRHKSEHISTAVRIALAPLARRTRVVHLGASLEYRDLDGGSRFRYRTRPGSALMPAMLNTSRLSGVRDVLTFGAEGAWMYRSLSMQGEYMASRLDRRGASTLGFDGWYVQGSWFLTRDRRPYQRSLGVFGRVEPRSAFGALELVARTSRLDLDDGAVLGGRSRDYSVGLNWYFHRNLRLMLDFTQADVDPSGGAPNEKPRIFGLRIAGFL